MSLPATLSARIRPLSSSAPRAWPSTVRIAAIAALLVLAAAPALAATYKWTDANGRVIYSDQPPNGNFKVEAINAPPPPANPNAAKELAAKEAEMQQRKLLRADEEAKAAKTLADTSQKREQCGRIRGQIAMMQTDQSLLYRSNEKGEKVFMDDTGRRREIQKLEAWVRENCAS